MTDPDDMPLEPEPHIGPVGTGGKGGPIPARIHDAAKLREELRAAATAYRQACGEGLDETTCVNRAIAALQAIRPELSRDAAMRLAVDLIGYASRMYTKWLWRPSWERLERERLARDAAASNGRYTPTR